MEYIFLNGLYEYQSSCRGFIDSCVTETFNNEIKNKIKQYNFINIMCDSAADLAAIEKEGMYVLFF